MPIITRQQVDKSLAEKNGEDGDVVITSSNVGMHVRMNVSFNHEDSGEDLFGIYKEGNLIAQTIDPDCAVVIYNHYVQIKQH